MKGVIFTELVRFMEAVQSPAFADAVIEAAGVASGGAYTSVGDYPSGEALDLVAEASARSGVAAHDLCRLFGNHLYTRFQTLYPHIMINYTSADELLTHVGSHIHHEVCILYPDARPPHIEAAQTPEGLTLTYQSHRPMAAIAFGLIEQCMRHHEDSRTLEWSSSPDGRRATFTLRSHSDA